MAPGFSDPEELLTRVSDDDQEVLGPVARRAVHGNPALIHRSVHVLVLHPDGDGLLLQKRSALKDMHPGQWDTSVGGHVGYGQSYADAALRESEEELGLRLTLEDLTPLHVLRYRGPDESENTQAYLCVHAGPFVPEPEEIDALRFWTRAEITAELGTGTFTPNFELEFAAFTGGPQGSRLR